MCIFFSFVTYRRKRYYFNAKQRKNPPIGSSDNPYKMDSHASICEFYGIPEDKANKYEFNSGGFTVDQINGRDDSIQAERWMRKFSKTVAFGQLCHMVIAENGFALGEVPHELRTLELCLAAVAQNGRALCLVPDELRTLEVLNIAKGIK